MPTPKLLKPNVELLNVPALLDDITTDGVLSFVGVLIGVVSLNVGATVSIVNVVNVNVLEFPALSVTVTESPLYVLSTNVLNVIVLLPAIIFVELLKLNVELVIVPALLDDITTDGVLSFVGVLIGVVSLNVGATVSIVNVVNIIDLVFPVASVNVTVSPLYVLSANALNVIVLSPSIPLVVLLKPNELLIVPASFDVITTDGVLIFVGVLIGVLSLNVGPTVSIINVVNVIVVAFPIAFVNVTVTPLICTIG